MIAIIQLLALTLFTPPNHPIQDIDSTADRLKSETAIVEWADASFYGHEGDKFEHFKAFYTDEYFIQTMRLETYAERIQTLKESKLAGTYKGTEENYNTSLKQLEDALATATNTIDKIERVTHFESHFWSNIKTTDGITVYYELIIKLDNDYKIIDAIENSSIGKKTTDTRIVYKGNSQGTKVIEKEG